MAFEGSTARLTVFLDRILANYGRLALRVAPAVCAAVVKADAYGLGIGQVAPVLARAGCQRFYVACVGEGVALRAILPEQEIIVINGFHENIQSIYNENRLIPVLNDLQSCKDWKHPACVQVETGMHRSGLAETEWIAARGLLRQPLLRVISHLACADDPQHPLNRQQLAAMHRAMDAFGVPGSLAASHGTLFGTDFHLDEVRPGAALYGATAHPDSQPVIHLSARVLEVRTVPAGATVGYGATFAAPSPRRIATVGIGYADGYPRALGNRGVMLWEGHRLPVVGRVSMDLVTLDVTAAPDVQPGMWVDVYNDLYTVNDAAQDAGTIGYEILTRLGKRVERIYKV